MLVLDNVKLFNALAELEIIDDVELKDALKQADTKKDSLVDILLEKDLINNNSLGRIVGDLIKVPYVDFSNEGISDEALEILPESYAKKKGVLVYKKTDEGVFLAMTNPSDEQTKQFVTKKTGEKLVIRYITPRDLFSALTSYARDTRGAFEEVMKENITKAKGQNKAEPPIIKIVDTLMSHAYKKKSSDIHIEPFDEYSLVRFRVDGILHDIVKLPINIHSRIVTRVKVLAKLRTDEHMAAQDGKIVYKTDSEDLDLRISIVPITEGEKVVMRLLSEQSRQFSLPDLGLSAGGLEKTRKAFKKPHGMILATGPTGSGKTTTLYAILKKLNRRGVNIMTIEDPVEYNIEGVNQIQVNARTELTFSKGLRSIVRQDPDIILVGEIRDEETADIAINAAMTGHLVLSTLHTNDAATTIPRLIDMKIEPFLIGSTVNVVVAQRLVRKVHSGCRVGRDIDTLEISKQIGEELTKKIFGETKARIYTGKGCKLDNGTGYQGRVGVFEVMVIDDEIRQAIVDKKDATVIRKIAKSNGMKTMLEDGLEKVKQGITTIEEVVRVTKE